MTRDELNEKWGKTYTTAELTQNFQVESFF
jgi:hypothetical protein